MENYKILVNRPELTSEQMTQSLEFTKVKSYYAVSKKALIKSAFIKSVFIKVAIGATVLTSGIVIYKNNSGSTREKQQPILTDTVQTTNVTKEEIIITNDTNILNPSMSFTKSPVKNNVVAIRVNSVSASNTAHDSISEIIVPLKETKKKDSAIINSNTKPTITKSKKPFTSSPNATCSLWNINSFCEYPSSSKFPTNIDCSSGCEFNYTNCNDLSAKTNIKGVRITVTDKKSKFKLKTSFKNITLTRNSNGETIYPLAVGIGNTDQSTKEARYINNTFKSRNCIVSFSNKVDIYLFFVGAKTGDKIIIDDFIQVEIVE